MFAEAVRATYTGVDAAVLECAELHPARVDELALPADILAQASQAALRPRFPDLFDRPYISATRYLIDATV